MFKKGYILFVVVIISQTVFGQLMGRDNLSIATFYLIKEELDSAQKYIDLSIEDEDLKSSAKTWFYRGYLYKEIFKANKKSNKVSTSRLTSIEAYLKCLTLPEQGDFEKKALIGLKYLASSSYNDGVHFIDIGEYDLAVDNFNQYKRLMLVVDTNFNENEADVSFYLSLATRIKGDDKPLEDLDSTQFNRLEDIYLKILSIDSNHAMANFNLAILYYNLGAGIAESVGYDSDLNEVFKAEDKYVEIFLKGLPYMKKSYDLNYNREDALIGLSSIYYGLMDMEKYYALKKELDDLQTE